MESNLLKSPKLERHFENYDPKYVSGLSTILVATIQEAKDRISQIEYIFCSQLFQYFHTNFNDGVQKIYSKAREAAELAFQEKEKDLMLKIKNLQLEKQRIVGENNVMMSEKEKCISMERDSRNQLTGLLEEKILEVMELKEKVKSVKKELELKSALARTIERRIADNEERRVAFVVVHREMMAEAKDLKMEIRRKSEEIKDLEWSQKEMLKSKDSLLKEKDAQLKEFYAKTEKLGKKLNELQLELRDKASEVDKGKELQGNLLKKMEFQAAEIMNYEQENKLLASKVETLVSSGDELQREITKKNCEIQGIGKLIDHMLRFIESTKTLDIEHALKELEGFDVKQFSIGDKVDKLKKCLSRKANDSTGKMESNVKLQQSETELHAERKKRMDAILAYKKLKSQYNYLLRKYAESQENMQSISNKEDDTTPLKNINHAGTSNIHSKEPLVEGDARKIVDEAEETGDKKRDTDSGVRIATKHSGSTESDPPRDAKRPCSYWRNTRSHQSRVGPDLHDDFLDTPLENMKHKVGTDKKENISVSPDAGPINLGNDNSDDETQDMDVEAGVAKFPMPPPPKSGFKYVEPVRKKSERENLKGIECKQCKKFYDAVLPRDGQTTRSDQQHIRCEHHDGVSRHRYRYAPPSTPEGFWNIGFESEM